MSAFAFNSNLPTATVLGFLGEYWSWIVGGLVVVLGLFAWGLPDVARFSFKRVWAISGVCFSESIRKRVLWITPLAIVSVIIVTQLQRALDEQDAIRQTIKFCLFATGMVVILSSLILACTNLPKEIESRVIFTIVTKPTTRLEIILGKVLGFARVSAAILLIMGLFTWVYLHICERIQLDQIATRLQEGNASETEKSRLTHYTEAGLLNARELWYADKLQVLGSRPDYGSDIRSIQGDGDQDFLVAFQMNRNLMFPDGPDSGIGAFGMVIQVSLDWERTGPIEDSPAPEDIVETTPVLGPAMPTTRPRDDVSDSPAITVDVADSDRFSTITGPNMIGATNLDKLANAVNLWSSDHKQMPRYNASRVRLHKPGHGYSYVWVPPTLAQAQLYNLNVFYIRVTGVNENVKYIVGKEPVRIYLPQPVNGRMVLAGPPTTEILAIPDQSGQPAQPLFRGRMGTRGEQELSGGSDQPSAAMFTFQGAPLPRVVNGKIPFEIRGVQLRRSNESDSDESREDPTVLAITVHDAKSNKDTTAGVQIESRQTAFFSVPADAITGPDYDVLLQCPNKGHTVGFYGQSLELVVDHQSFAYNLFKSLSIIWLMSVLVIVISIFCSTWLSWPIAIVLTVILLLSHWGVNQLADTNAPGLGRTIVNDFKIKDATDAKVISSSVDWLSTGLNAFAKILPDTSHFDAIGEIEQGATVSGPKIFDALLVMAGFSLPGIVGAYLILRCKEVAP